MRWWLFGLVLIAGCSPDGVQSVTVYCSHDRSHSEKILDQFEQATGIRVDAIYDTEATKTVGLAQRIRSERKRPRCDVHWSNEPLRAVLLAQEGLYRSLPSSAGVAIGARWRDPQNLWCGFAARARAVAIFPPSATRVDAPDSVHQLADPGLLGKVVIADPRFGTTGSHLAILRARLGPDRFRRLLQSWKTNQIQVASSNSASRDRVISGEAWIGLTDTDDIEVVRRRGVEIDEGFLTGDGVILLPNVIALVNGSPHPVEAEQLASWLLRSEVEEWLAASPSRQIALSHDAVVPEGGLGIAQLDPIEIDWVEAASQLRDAVSEAERILLNP
jgi:iron(III) transport system substrate-binding protein